MAVSTTYTKTQVRNAGKLWAAAIRVARARDVDQAWQEFGAKTLTDAHGVIAWWRAQHAYPLTMVNANLRHYVRDYDSRVAQRLKKQGTILDKLVREPAMDLTRMEDIGGCRIVLPSQQEVDAVVRKLRKNWNRSITRHRDYVADPKEDGYRAHHLIVAKRGRKIEVQLRTR